MSEHEISKFSFRAVEVFVTIIEEGAVNAAAKRLGASPSALSLQLSNLEATLGARLIQRSSRHLALTEAGEVFYPRALNILDEVSSAKAALARTSPTSRLLIKMSVIEDFDTFVLPSWLTALKLDFPNLRFNIQSGPSHENHAALVNRSADMIVAIETSETSEWVEAHDLLFDPYILVRSRNLGEMNSLEELMDMPFVRYSREQFMARQIEAHLKRNKRTPARDHEFSSNHAVFSMVEALEGWTITTACAFAFTNPNLAGPNARLVASKLPMPSFSRKISLYARRDALGEIPLHFAETLQSVLKSKLQEQRLAFLDPETFFPQ